MRERPRGRIGPLARTSASRHDALRPEPALRDGLWPGSAGVRQEDLELGLEGIVSKRVSSLYRSGSGFEEMRHDDRSQFERLMIRLKKEAHCPITPRAVLSLNACLRRRAQRTATIRPNG